MSLQLKIHTFRQVSEQIIIIAIHEYGRVRDFRIKMRSLRSEVRALRKVSFCKLFPSDHITLYVAYNIKMSFVLDLDSSIVTFIIICFTVANFVVHIFKKKM